MPPRQPLYVTLFARALGSICFGISIFALTVVWLNLWQQPLPNIPARKKSNRRRSAPATLESPINPPTQPPEPLTTSIMTSTSPVESLTRHVYFIDSQTTPRRSNSSRSSPSVDLSSSSPVSSSSTLVSHVPPPAVVDACEDSAVESDYSSKKSARSGFQLPKLLSKVHRKAPSSVEGYASQSDGQAPISALKRSSTGNGIQKHWALPRTRTTVSELEISDKPASSSPRMPFRFPGSRVVSTPVCTPFTNNSSLPPRNQRRPSSSSKVPVPRTQPYAAPYFAAFPTAKSPEGQEPTSEFEARGRDRRQINAQAQASLGIGRPLHKRRSASESWVVKGAVAPLN